MEVLPTSHIHRSSLRSSDHGNQTQRRATRRKNRSKSRQRSSIPMDTWRSIYKDDSQMRMHVTVNRRGWTELNLDSHGLRDIPLEVFNFHGVEVLHASKNKIGVVPVYIGHLRKLRVLDLHQNQIVQVPETLCNCTHLYELNLMHNKIRSLPPHIGKLKYLRILKLGHNQLETLLSEVCKLENLKVLEVQSNRLTLLPFTFQNLRRLKSLNLASNKFDSFPLVVTQIRTLEVLNMRGNNLKTLPQDVENMKVLRDLNLQQNQFDTFPHVLISLKNLLHLNIAHSQIKSLPQLIGKMTRLKTLHVEKNKLTSLSCNFENLEYLNAANNQITNCALFQLKHLRYLNLNYNRLDNMPLGVCNLGNLHQLKLNHNRIQYLSKDVELLKELRVFDLSHNRLTQLPQSINELVKLEYFDTKGNKITNRPIVLDMKAMKVNDNTDEDVDDVENDDRNRTLKLNKRASRNSKPQQRSSRAKQHYSSGDETRPKTVITRDATINVNDVSGYDSWDSTAYRNGDSTKANGHWSDTSHFLQDKRLHRYTNSPVSRKLRSSEKVIRPHHHQNLKSPGETMNGRNYEDAMHRYNRHQIPPKHDLIVTRHVDNDVMYPAWKLINDNWMLLRKGDHLKERLSPAPQSSHTSSADTVLHNNWSVRTDYTLLGLCNQLESLLQHQLLKPVISHRGNFHRLSKPDFRAPDQEQTNIPSLQNESPPNIYPYSADLKGSLIRLKPDKFTVTPAGGLFQCSLDPNIKIFFPVNAVDAPTDIIMQLEKVDQESLLQLKFQNKMIDNIITMGHIVHLWQSRNLNFNEQVLVTIPAPPQPQKGRLHVLTYRDDNTCTPCSSGYKLINGYITIQTWHFSGKGAILTKAKCKYKACKSVEHLLHNLYI